MFSPLIKALRRNVNGCAKLEGLAERDFTQILWTGRDSVCRHELDEKAQTLKLWVRRKSGNRVVTCSGWSGPCTNTVEIRQREVRDLL